MAISIQGSSGDVFTDLGFEPGEALSLRLRADSMIEISTWIEERGLSQTEAAEWLLVEESRVEDLVEGEIDRFNVGSLIEMRNVI